MDCDVEPSGPVVRILYTNHRGETALRRIIPERMWWGATDWHGEGQWLLDAFDLGRMATRSFALRDMVEFEPETGERVPHGSGVGGQAQRPRVRVRV